MIVVDASIAIKWFIPEEGSEEALRILNDHIFGREEIFVPDLLFYEVVNALRYKQGLAIDGVGQFIDTLSRLELKRISTDENYLKDIFHTAREFDISAYDAAYVTLAKIFNCTLATADVKLSNKISDKIKIQIL